MYGNTVYRWAEAIINWINKDSCSKRKVGGPKLIKNSIEK
jgi:hypothetical protein